VLCRWCHTWFHQAANSIFGKVEPVASEEVVSQYMCRKFMPILLYGLEACRSLDFVNATLSGNSAPALTACSY